MADIVEMIQLSPTMEEGLIVEWLKKEGDAVETGDLIAEVETDKATMEMESFFDGVILKILAPAGEAAKVGTPIAIIGEEGEDISDLLAELEGGVGGEGGDEAAKRDTGDASADGDADGDADSGADAGADADAASDGEGDSDARDDAGGEAPKSAEKESAKGEGDAPGESGSKGKGTAAKSGDTNGRILSSPLARKIAEEKGLDLANIEGSGPGGRIVRKDVEAAAKAPRKAATPARAAAADPASLEVGGEDVALSQMRKTIARRLTEAWQAPAFMLTRTIAMDALMALRKQINADLEAADTGRKISVNDLLIRACALGLREVPEMNAAYLGDKVRLFDSADIGVAVAIEGGLITPVVRRAHEKSVGAIAEEARDLIARARTKKLAPEEFTNATFSISNLGMMGIEHFTAVLNPPAAGILAVGSVRRVPVVTEAGELGIGQRMTVTLTCDHRTVDGAVGATFLEAVARRLERPVTLLI